MASQAGYNIDDGSFSQENIPPDPRSRDLPSKRLLGKGLASIGYETEWVNGVSYARKDFVGVPSDIFRKEADILVNLKDHQNVVKTHGLTVDKLSCSLVLEYMDDKLSGLLQKKKDQRKRTPAGTDSGNQSDHSHALLFELQEALDLMLQIARGMEYIHEQEVIHGDLKTRNILVTYKNNGDKNLSVKAVKVSDFGLVQTKRNSMSYASRQVCKLDMVRWKAPENLKMLLSEAASSESDFDPDEECTGSGIVEMPADIYSFALICFQILTGEEAYPKRKWKDMVQDIVSGKLRPKLPPDPPCPTMLSKLLISCWDTDPSERPSFFDIREKLEHMLTPQTWTVKDEQEQNQPEPLEKDCSSLKSMELVGPNSSIPEASDADRSSKMDYSAPDSAVLLRKGKDLMPEYLEPKESISNVLSRTGERETFEEIHDPIQTESIPDDADPSDQFRDNCKVSLNPRDGSAISRAMDDWTLEPFRPPKRPRVQYFSSPAMDVDEVDVFLNYRGPGVEANFMVHLEEALRACGFIPFLNKKSLMKGNPAFSSIDEALAVAKVYVAVVSRRYAESKYRLRELVAILRTRKPVIPVFYDVEPSDLRRVESGPFAAAFDKHKSRETPEQVDEWRDALQKLAEITGFCFRLSDYKNVDELKWQVVDATCTLIPTCKEVQSEHHLVGIEEHVNICINNLEKMSGTTCLLGIVGVGGIGKTALAKSIYNHLVNCYKFQAMSFLEIDYNLSSSWEVKQGLFKRLQKQLVWDLFHKELTTSSYNYWLSKLSNQGPVLVVLDDIRDKMHYEGLICYMEFLPPGSCVIVTSRDIHLLKAIAAEYSNFYLHEVTPLGCNDSKKLFNWHAFGNEEAPKNFEVWANDISKVCGGLPLALKVVGSSLFGKTSDEDQEIIWLAAMDALKKNATTMNDILKWSYDILSKSEKLMFVDIACIFNGQKKKEALEVWKSCNQCTSCNGFETPYTSLKTLIDKSLVKLEYFGGDEILTIHDLLRDMGQSVGRSKGSYLCENEAPIVLSNRFQKLKKVRVLNLTKIRNHVIDAKIFAKMSNLHFLTLDGCYVTGNLDRISKELRWLQWRFMPLTHLPPISNLFNLISLDLSLSDNLANAWVIADSTLKDCHNLLRLNLSECISITTLPGSIGYLSRLQVLDLHGCGKLQELPSSIGQLKELEQLDLAGCGNLKALPDTITALSGLQQLHLEGCSSISKLPPRVGLMAGLTSLSIDLGTEGQAGGIGQLHALKYLTVTRCTDEAVTVLDSSDAFRNLNQLVEFNFYLCKAITKLPDTIGLLTKLDILRIFSCEKLEELPNSIGQLGALKTLDLRECNSLRTLPDTLGALKSLEYLLILQCTSITKLPTSIGNLSSLWGLTIAGCDKLQLLPDSVSQLNALKILQILDCGNLETLGVLKALQGLRIWGCTSITELLGSSLIVLDSGFWDPSWYNDVKYSTVVRRNLKELEVVEENDCGFLRHVKDTQTGRSILQRVHNDTCSQTVWS